MYGRMSSINGTVVLLGRLQQVNALLMFVRRFSRSNMMQQHHLVAKRMHTCLMIQKCTLV